MRRGKIFDYKTHQEREVYYRSKQSYGDSYIWLEPLYFSSLHSRKGAKDSEDVLVGDKKIWIPFFDIQKYYPDARCYALIEQIQAPISSDSTSTVPITMIDILYTPRDILPKLKKDDRFLEQFLSMFTREKINAFNMNFPFLFMTPNKEELPKFMEAMKLAIQEAFGIQYVGMEQTLREKGKVLDPNAIDNDVKEEGIVLDFIKSFYEILSGKPVKRNTDKKMIEINSELSKKAMLIKSGATIIPGNIIGKYYVHYYVGYQENGAVKEFTDSLSVHIEDLDDGALLNTAPGTQKRKERFGKTLFDSCILETCSYINMSKKPRLVFLGKYNETAERLEVSKRVEQYFDRMNELMGPHTRDDDGR